VKARPHFGPVQGPLHHGEPVLTLWAAVVAQHLGFAEDEALTSGQQLNSPALDAARQVILAAALVPLFWYSTRRPPPTRRGAPDSMGMVLSGTETSGEE
jgi:hypothetical protein